MSSSSEIDLLFTSDPALSGADGKALVNRVDELTEPRRNDGDVLGVPRNDGDVLGVRSRCFRTPGLSSSGPGD